MSNARLFALFAGFILWAAGFVVLYAMLSVGCEFGWQNREVLGGVSLQRVQLVAILIAHIIVSVLLVIVLKPRDGGFLSRAAYLAALAALGASIFNFAGVFVLSPCV